MLGCGSARVPGPQRRWCAGAVQSTMAWRRSAMTASPNDLPMSAPALDAVHTIFHARSIAVVGATERAGYGARFVSTLLRSGYSGQLFPINPSRSEVFGLP